MQVIENATQLKARLRERHDDPDHPGSDRLAAVCLTDVLDDGLSLVYSFYHPILQPASLGTYLNFYNTRRPHQSLDGQTPDEIYFAGLPQEKLAA